MIMRVAAAALATLAAAASPASAARESTVQDDHRLLDGTTAQRRSTLDEMGKLGADRVRLTVLWRRLAPSPDSRTRPSFDASDPAAYPSDAFAPYDAVVRDAAARGLGVNLDVSGPAPLWATRRPPRSDIAATYEPSAEEFGRFVTALGRRYSGDVANVPRVSYWSLWNEPNQSGWLTPQWRGRVERAPAIYRALAAAGWDALVATGHRRDTVLVGDTAPKGLASPGDQALPDAAGVRARALLRRPQASAPARRGRPARATAPSATRARSCARTRRCSPRAATRTTRTTCSRRRRSRPRDPDFVTIGSLDRLTRTLDRILRAYGVRRRLPLYLTEFGYQTPPDPFGVPFGLQATWLNQSEYIAARNPRVRTLGQFLLYDDGAAGGLDVPERAALARRLPQAVLGGVPAARLAPARARAPRWDADGLGAGARGAPVAGADRVPRGRRSMDHPGHGPAARDAGRGLGARAPAGLGRAARGGASGARAAALPHGAGARQPEVSREPRLARATSAWRSSGGPPNVLRRMSSNANAASVVRSDRRV